MASRSQLPDDSGDPGETASFEPVSLEGMGGGSGDSELIRRLSGRGAGSSRYQRMGEVARGGQGAILRVFDEDLRRHLAMKVTLDATDTGESSPHVLGRFLEEAQVTGQLDHPGIVPVHELGLDSDGRVYFTMKLVKGRDLRAIFDLVREGREGWTVTRALGVMLKVCEAMTYAHAKGVIHRDLKPGNVMVGRYGEVYVMDWGLARVLGVEDRRDLRIDSASPEGASLPYGMTTGVKSSRRDKGDDVESPLMTMDGDVVGTPAYMPPEQALGDLEAMGPHSDVYAVGAMVYHLLTGHMPYVLPGMRVNNYAVWALVQKGPPEALNDTAGEAPAELVAICEKAMAREVSARYADMRALSEDLRAYLEGRVVAAHGTGAVAELRKWIQRNRGLATATAAAAVLLVVGTIVSSSLFVKASRNEERALWQSYVANIGAANGRLDAGAAADAAARLEACPQELRGWEWDYLSNRVDTSLASVEAADTFLSAVAYGPDGQYIATGGGPTEQFGEQDFSVRILDAQTLAPVRVLEGHEAQIWNLDFSPAGTELVSSDHEGGIRVWDVTTGEVLAQHAVEDMGHVVAYHPDGLRIGVGWGSLTDLKDGGSELWNTLTGERSFRQRGSSVESIAFSEDGALMALGNREGVVGVWELDSPSILPRGFDVGQIPGDEGFARGVTDLDFSSDRSHLLAATGGGTVLLFDIQKEEMIRVFRGHDRPATGARFGAGDRWVITSGLDGTVRIWDTETAQLLEVLHGHDDYVTGIDLSPNRDRIVSASFDRTVRIWDAQPGSAVTYLRGVGEMAFPYYTVAFDPTGEKLAWRPDPRTVRVSDARTGLELYQLPSAADFVFGIAFDRKGRLYTLATYDRLRIWDAETGELLEVVGEPFPGLHFVDFSPDRTSLAAWAADGEPRVQVWSTSTGETIHSWPVDSTAWKVRFSPDGTRLVAGHGNTISIWELSSGEKLHEITTSSKVWDVAIGPHSELIAATFWDPLRSDIGLWDLSSGELLRNLEGHARPAVVTFSPDGTRLLTGNWFEGSMSLLDLERGAVVSLHGLRGTVRDVVFAPDGRRIASAEDGGVHHIWDTTSVAERAAARDHAARERVLERRARPVVDALFERAFLPEDVVALLRADKTLPDDVRATAMRLARVRGVPTTDEFIARVAGLCLRPGPPADYRHALDYLLLVPRLRASREEEANLALRPFLGAAQYRLELYEAALESLTTPFTGWEEHRVRLLFLAMTFQRLGRSEEARAALEQGRTSLNFGFPGPPSIQKALPALLAEANLLVEGE